MSPDGSSIVFEYSPKSLDRKRVRAFYRRLTSELTAPSVFNCLLSKDARLQQLNRDFLNHDYPTDVLSFPSRSTSFIGELAISLDRAAEQAKSFRHPLETEIEILMLHGALHLLGMDHEMDHGRMARAESAWRRKLNLPLTLIQRSRQRT
ncbi:MAG TPA: rRNA maturation RNase YbeY [Bryobacteraceae bacterium]|nr:rRNA maturation RNase YbeY [Bryobacteraceae bacterium]